MNPPPPKRDRETWGRAVGLLVGVIFLAITGMLAVVVTVLSKQATATPVG
ncbi:MAG: hypothetical protein AAFW98_04460 [Pseudomonadota bacterium]